MTELEKTLFDMIRAAASGSVYEIPATVDHVALYRAVRRLHLSAFLWESASRLPDSELRRAWDDDRHKAMLKDLMQTEETEAISEALSKAGIRFAFLKGTELRRYWGEPYFRYRGDLDFYYEGDDAVLRRALEGIGYDAERFGARGVSHHFSFKKAPWFTLEPHFVLVSSEDPYAGLLTELFERATPDPDCVGRYRLSIEDLYLHCLIHLRKHVEAGGIGVRSFLDFAFLLREYPDLPDRARVQELLDGAGLGAFEKSVLRVAALFSDPSSIPDEEDEREISALFDVGLFGTFETEFGNRLQNERARSRFPRTRVILKCAFPTLAHMTNVRFRAPLSWLVYPVFWCRRALNMLFTGKLWRKTGESLRALAAYSADGADGGRELRYFGLLPDGNRERGKNE